MSSLELVFIVTALVVLVLVFALSKFARSILVESIKHPLTASSIHSERGHAQLDALERPQHLQQM